MEDNDTEMHSEDDQNELSAQFRGPDSEAIFRNLVEYSLVGMFIVQDDRFIYVNPKFEDIFGYMHSEMISLESALSLVDKDDLAIVLRDLGGRGGEGKRRRVHTSMRCRRKDGVQIEVELHAMEILHNGSPAVSGTIIDITDRREMEADLLKSQKLESLGIIASGIAHEFNNILTAIMGNIVLAKMYAKPELEVFDILSEAEKAAQRAEDLTRQLLAFSKGGTLFKKVISLQGLISEITAFSLKDSAVRTELSLPDDLRPVEADEGQIRQAISNLIINASQAMPGGGTIRIQGENITADPETQKGGEYVKISVEDQGQGIDESHIEKIFDPFFTTKEKASGLGLASSLSIIRNHGGSISVASRPGSGTIFSLYLPAANNDGAAKTETRYIDYLSGKKVLVMDDEEIVRTVIERMLNQCGCRPAFAKDGEEMINLYRKSMDAKAPFDAVIIDVIIASGMGGKEAVRKLLEMDPDAKAIVSSGYSDDLIMADFRRFGFQGVLPKPYRLSELNRVLSEVIAGAKN